MIIKKVKTQDKKGEMNMKKPIAKTVNSFY